MEDSDRGDENCNISTDEFPSPLLFALIFVTQLDNHQSEVTLDPEM